MNAQEAEEKRRVSAEREYDNIIDRINKEAQKGSNKAVIIQGTTREMRDRLRGLGYNVRFGIDQEVLVITWGEDAKSDDRAWLYFLLAAGVFVVAALFKFVFS